MAANTHRWLLWLAGDGGAWVNVTVRTEADRVFVFPAFKTDSAGGLFTGLADNMFNDLHAAHMHVYWPLTARAVAWEVDVILLAFKTLEAMGVITAVANEVVLQLNAGSNFRG